MASRLFATTFALLYRAEGESKLTAEYIQRPDDAVFATVTRLLALRVRNVAPTRETLDAHQCKMAVISALHSGSFLVMQPDGLFPVQIVRVDV
jgi:hypothetical protein